MKSDAQRLKLFDRFAYLISVVVIFMVIGMRQEDKPDFGISFSFLPPLYSALNALTAMLLLLALWQIKKKNILNHKRLMMSAMFTSVLFLLGYVLYHFTTPETKYCGEGSIRYFYFFLLITHIILAGAILPFILLTFNRGYLMMTARHKKMARWVFPLWFYVVISGPVIYLMLAPCYNH